MSHMMTLHQASQWIGSAELIGNGQTKLTRVHTDSRSIEPGDLFVALKGERYDANEFLTDAATKGAAAIICESRESLLKAGLPGLVVSDTRAALGVLATAWREQFKLPLIAVTGSNGKTTVTQMIAAILRVYRPTSMLATQGNFNNDIGVPLTLLRIRAEHQIAVLELGMNHPGEIAHLAMMAKPSVALVNNAQREHLEFMATLDAVAHENGSVIGCLPANGVSVYPSADEFSPSWHDLSGHRAQLTFGIASGSEPSMNSNARLTSGADVSCALPEWIDGAWRLQVITPAGDLQVNLRIAGAHNVKNALAAIACTLACGVPLEAIARGLDSFEPVKGRTRALFGDINGTKFTLIDDTYNANPDSVRAAIDVLAGLPHPRLLVLGDMGEVGSNGPRFHAEAGEYAKALGIESLITVGDLSAIASAQFGSGIHKAKMVDVKKVVLEALPLHHSILVKGSRFMQMEQIVEAIMVAGNRNAQASKSSESLSKNASLKEAKCS